MKPSLPNPGEQARIIRSSLPEGGLFAGHEWRISPEPFRLIPEMGHEIESMGRVLLQFYRAANLLYRQSFLGKQPVWISTYLDHGKPTELVQLQRESIFKNDLPRVIRPDILITDTGLVITELDSVPGGIGLTAWLQKTYSLQSGSEKYQRFLGGQAGMIQGFSSIFPGNSRVLIVVSEEAASYRPEMCYLSKELNHIAISNHSNDNPHPLFQVVDGNFTDYQKDDTLYRFFELFDVEQVPTAKRIFYLAQKGMVFLTPPPKAYLEEKMLFALFWNRNLRDFWRQELGDAFYRQLKQWIPYTWIIDPTPLPPQAAIPDLPITDWRQLKSFSQKERNLIIKVSGYSENAWGARGVYLGSDLSHQDWSRIVDSAIDHFDQSPHILQRFSKPKLVEASWYDFDNETVVPFKGRTRLCPYFFVNGHRETARANLGGVLATICPENKKIIHGMSEAVLIPCVI